MTWQRQKAASHPPPTKTLIRGLSGVANPSAVAMRLPRHSNPSMYAKVFRQIYESSIAETPELRFTFMDLLILADADGIVDMTPESIARITNRPLEEIKQHLAVLEAPDPKSRSKEAEGRRIARLDDHRDWGWFIINYDKFRRTATEADRREHARVRASRYRARVRAESSEDESPAVTPPSRPVTLRNASVTPLYASVSASASEGGEGLEGEGSVELPPKFPKTSAAAIAMCSTMACPPSFVETTWEQASARGGRDARDIPIRSFQSHVAVCWKYQQERNAVARANGKPVKREKSLVQQIIEAI